MRENLRVIAAGVLGFLFSILATLLVDRIGSPLPTWFWLVTALAAVLLLAFLAGVTGALIRWGWDRQRFRQPMPVGFVYELAEVAERDPGLGRPHCEIEVSIWKLKLSELQKDDRKLFKVDSICFRHISPKFGIIVNPFGELYAEEDHLERRTVKRIKEFLRAGGIFVCTGGIPLYYRWIAETQSRVDTTLTAVVIQGQSQLGIARMRLFDDTLISTEFGVRFSASPSSETLCKTYQTEEDKQKLGDLVHEGGTDQVLLFRPVIPGRNVIPALRGRVSDDEVYPIAAVSYGKGYLIFSGMHIKDVEFAKIMKAVETLALNKLTPKQR